MDLFLSTTYFIIDMTIVGKILVTMFHGLYERVGFLCVYFFSCEMKIVPACRTMMMMTVCRQKRFAEHYLSPWSSSSFWFLSIWPFLYGKPIFYFSLVWKTQTNHTDMNFYHKLFMSYLHQKAWMLHVWDETLHRTGKDVVFISLLGTVVPSTTNFSTHCSCKLVIILCIFTQTRLMYASRYAVGYRYKIDQP
jgi:hypothetical protein